MISIIIPVYNSETTIGRCLDSVINQTYHDWEALVVVDGGTDKSALICDNYAREDDRVRVFHQENSGVSKARNLGMSHAQGEWITFADSDDYLEPHALQTYLETAHKYQADVVRGGYFREFDDGRQETVTSDADMVFTDTCPFFRTMERKELYSFLWTLFIKKSCVGELRFNEHLNWLEDHTFSYSIYLKSNRMVIVGKPLYHYAVHQTGSLSDVRNPYVVKEAAEIELKLKTQLIHGENVEMQNQVEDLYRFRLTTIVNLLYRNTVSYNERKQFTQNCKTLPHLKFKEERIFFAQGVPFMIKDLLLKLLFFLKRKK